MNHGKFSLPEPSNEPVLSYRPGSPEKKELKAKLKELSQETIEIPLIIGGKEVHTGDVAQSIIPHDHEHVLANYHKAGEKEIEMAIEAS